MISDFVKGKKQYTYPNLIFKGIKLHRSIDQFTDTHPITSFIKSHFKNSYGLYAGAFVDIVYDYFLANDKNEFATSEKLKIFVQNTYQGLRENIELLPENFRPFFEHMQTHDWLYHYQSKTAIEKSFAHLVHRAKFLSDAAPAFSIFEENISRFQPYYDDFFPQLKEHAFKTFKELVNID